MRVVILGCGRVGALLAEGLDRDGHDVRIVDQRSESFRRLSPGFRGKTIVGQGIDVDVLRDADADSADAFAAVTDNDNTNIMASQVAKVIFNIPKIVTRIYDPLREEAYHDLGLDTISPTTLGAELIEQMLATAAPPDAASPKESSPDGG